MSESRATGIEPPGWEVLISHHLPARYARTFAIRYRGQAIHFCARCSGQVLGLLALLLVYWVGTRQSLPLFGQNIQLLIALAPLPAALDWTTQALGRRESSNLLRAASGALLGFALTDVVLLIVTQRWLFVGGAFLVFTVYVAAVLLALKFSGAWRRVLEEHFPGFDPGPG
ncbi:MAG: DUF2085 domain-containing protein [Thermoplasmata archaeon]|nr:DUF2085 domain-containing protein [Thermoplasmata archaeon]